MVRLVLLVLALSCVCPGAGPALAGQDPLAAFAPLEGMAYRVDGARDEAGVYRLFADPARLFATSGLNCSGLVVELSRQTLGAPLPLADMSAPGPNDAQALAANGPDWDFGYRLILRIAWAAAGQGAQPFVLGEEGPQPLSRLIDAQATRGVSLDDPARLKALVAACRPGVLYLLSFSDRKTASGPLLHHHVAVLAVDPAGGLALLHATPGKGVHRLNLPPGREAQVLGSLFRATRPFDRRVLVLAVPLR